MQPTAAPSFTLVLPSLHGRAHSYIAWQAQSPSLYSVRIALSISREVLVLLKRTAASHSVSAAAISK